MVRTECAHCKSPMELSIDSNLNCTVKHKESMPMVFIPDVDLLNIQEENIINAF